MEVSADIQAVFRERLGRLKTTDELRGQRYKGLLYEGEVMRVGAEREFEARETVGKNGEKSVLAAQRRFEYGLSDGEQGAVWQVYLPNGAEPPVLARGDVVQISVRKAEQRGPELVIQGDLVGLKPVTL